MSIPALLALVLVACAPASPAPPAPASDVASGGSPVAFETFEGTFEPRWWMQGPGYGVSAEDGWAAALVLRLDTPRAGVAYVVYAPRGLDDLAPDAAALACVGGRATVRGRYTPVAWAEASAVVTEAQLVRCAPATRDDPRFGETATLSGTLRRWWWVLPGKEAEPWPNAASIGAVILVDGRPTPFFPRGEDAARERHRRFLAACDGQDVTVTGRWEPTRNAAAIPPYKLVDAAIGSPCASPALHGASGDTPVGAEWLGAP